MTMFLIWVLLVFGVNLWVTYSDFFDSFREWYLKKAGYPMVGNQYVQTQPQPPNKMPLWSRLAFKLVNCWLCTAFWTGAILSIGGFRLFHNPILAGFVAVGAIGVLRFWLFNRGNSDGS